MLAQLGRKVPPVPRGQSVRKVRPDPRGPLVPRALLVLSVPKVMSVRVVQLGRKA